jgi:hypothetical protein
MRLRDAIRSGSRTYDKNAEKRGKNTAVNGRFRGRFNRLFIVLSVVWIGYAITLPRKWAEADEQLQLSAAHVETFAQFHCAETDDDGKPGAPLSEEQKSALEELGRRVPGMTAEEKVRYDKIACRVAREIGQRHTNAWKWAFPGWAVLGGLALLLVPPVGVYVFLVGATKVVFWVWRGSREPD